MVLAAALTFAAFLFALAMTPVVRIFAMRIGAVDHPHERKLHLHPMPRLGGVAVALSVGLSICLMVALGEGTEANTSQHFGSWMAILAGALIIFAVGVWDDLRPLPVSIKLPGQLCAAALAVWLVGPVEQISFIGGDPLNLGLLSIPLTMLWIIAITNAFNLIDGLDGLAAGLAAIAAGTSGLIFLFRDDASNGLLLLILAGALLGFLYYNFNPATIFLGDSGSLLVGYLLAVTAMSGSQKSATTLAVLLPLLIFGLPILDTLLSMIRRFVASRGLVDERYHPVIARCLAARHLFRPDRNHIHHRLLTLGLSHRQAVLLLYAVACGLSATAVLSVLAQYRNAGLILLSALLATIIGVRKLGYEDIRLIRTSTLLQWYEHLSFNRLFFIGFVDLALLSAAYWGAFYLKYDVIPSEHTQDWYESSFPLALLLQMIVFTTFGLYRKVWRTTNFSDMMHLVVATACAVLLSVIVLHLNIPPEGNWSFFCINFLLLGALMGGSRNVYRILEYSKSPAFPQSRKALIYGAGRAGQLLLNELNHNVTLGIRAVGFLDDAPSLRGRVINNVPVLGGADDLDALFQTHTVTTVLFSSRAIPSTRISDVLVLCKDRGVEVLRARFDLEPLANTEAVTERSMPSMAVASADSHPALALQEKQA